MNAFPLFKPHELGYFSLNGDRTETARLCLDKSQLLYFYPPEKYPRVHFDLNRGIERFVPCDLTIWQRFEKILTWIGGNRALFRSPNNFSEDFNVAENLNVDFVTSRGHLVKIMTSRYDYSHDWHMAVTRYKDVLYMSEVDRIEMPDDFTGYKFEHYLNSRNGECSLNLEEQAVNGNEAYYTVISSKLGLHRLLYSAEVDCCAGPDHPDYRTPSPANYFELKTKYQITTEKQALNFRRFQLLKWWAQSFLAGVPSVVCGFKDNNGIVDKVETYRTMEIPGRNRELWDGNECLKYCSKVLQYVKEKAEINDPNLVYLFSYNARAKKVTYTLKRDPAYSFLPQWYIEGSLPPRLA